MATSLSASNGRLLDHYLEIYSDTLGAWTHGFIVAPQKPGRTTVAFEANGHRFRTHVSRSSHKVRMSQRRGTVRDTDAQQKRRSVSVEVEKIPELAGFGEVLAHLHDSVSGLGDSAEALPDLFNSIAETLGDARRMEAFAEAFEDMRDAVSGEAMEQDPAFFGTPAIDPALEKFQEAFQRMQAAVGGAAGHVREIAPELLTPVFEGFRRLRHMAGEQLGESGLPPRPDCPFHPNV